MENGRRIDPDILLRRHFSREIEEERNLPTSRVQHATTDVEQDGASRWNDRPPSRAPRRSAWFQEAAAAAVLAACVGAAFLAVPGESSTAAPEVLGAKAVIVGRLIETKLVWAVSEFADMRGPEPQGFGIPGRFREKEQK